MRGGTEEEKEHRDNSCFKKMLIIVGYACYIEMSLLMQEKTIAV